ncbi:hypothetical protein [Thiopseudomonas alkaliphila]|nr:hypothetical protein [Thiopseudomonas alkaliphila]
MYLFSPAIMEWWTASNTNSWYRPFILWFCLIVMTFFLQPHRKHDEL